MKAIQQTEPLEKEFDDYNFSHAYPTRRLKDGLFLVSAVALCGHRHPQGDRIRDKLNTAKRPLCPICNALR